MPGTSTDLDDYLAQYYYAEQALAAEYQYFKRKATSPFLTGPEQSVAAGNLTRIGAMLTRLRLIIDAELASGNALRPPTSELVGKVKKATNALAQDLQKATTSVAVLRAVTKFLDLLNILRNSST